MSLSDIARPVALNGIQNAKLDASLNAHRLKVMPPRMVRGELLVSDHRTHKLCDAILDALQGPLTLVA